MEQISGRGLKRLKAELLKGGLKMSDRRDTYPNPNFIRAPKYEMPHWSSRLRRNISLNHHLPTEALMAGYELWELHFEFKDVAWYLYDPEGRIIEEWKLKPPSLIEVFDLCQELLRA